MKLNSRNIFLLDGTGAVLSSLVTGMALPHFSDSVGLPVGIIRSMGLIAASFAVYSLSVYAFLKPSKPAMLIGIISANLVYCFISIMLAITSPEITLLGRAYFLGEVLIIIGVVYLELDVYQKMLSPKRTFAGK